MQNIFEPLRSAVRSLTRAPGFAVTATLTLALGIGLSTAVFTIARAILVQRLPVADQSRVVLLWGKTRDGHTPNYPLTLGDIRTLERQSSTLEQVGFFPFRGATAVPIRADDRMHSVQMALVSGNYFPVLGARPALGRTLRPEDDVAGAAPVIVLSYRAWQQRFGGDSAVIGRSIVTMQTGRSHTIVGVMPRGLDYPRGVEVWAPIIAYSSADGFHDLVINELDVIARLRAGASASDARAELASYFNRPNASPMQRKLVAVVRSFDSEVLGDTRPVVIIIGVAAALLLFISSVNVANLMLIRALGRARELVVRAALGASRRRILAQSLLESGALALAGGVLGVVFAVGAVRAFVAFAPPNVPRIERVAVSATTLVVAIVVTIVANIVSSVGPVALATRVDANHVLRSGSRSTSSGRIRLLLEGLVVAQIVLAVVCLTAAGLMTRSFMMLMRADLSFQSEGLLVAPLTVSSAELPDPTRVRAALELVITRLRNTPSVRSVALAYSPPFVGGGGGIDGRLSFRGENSPMLNLEVASPDIFTTLGTPILRGRAFNEGDREGSTKVVIVSASVARYFWHGEDPIGKQLSDGRSEYTIVGIVPDTRYRELYSARWSAYFPMRQSPFGPVTPTTLVIRSTDAPALLLPRIRQVIDETSPGLSAVGLTPVESMLNEPRGSARLNTMVLMLFAAAASLLAALGLFSVMMTMVRQRTRELGIRLALGATASDISALVLRRGTALSVVGGVIGLAVSVAVSQMLSTVAFEIRPADAPTLIATATVMLIVAAIASLVPARSSARIDPAIALRSES